MILHYYDITKENVAYVAEVTFTTDTIHFPDLSQYTHFLSGYKGHMCHIGTGRYYETISTELSKALLGFHATTSCDQTARFNGKNKAFWWKQFCNAVIVTSETDLLN